MWSSSGSGSIQSWKQDLVKKISSVTLVLVAESWSTEGVVAGTYSLTPCARVRVVKVMRLSMVQLQLQGKDRGFGDARTIGHF